MILSRTAYLTDAGMCGDYDSVIGMERTGLRRFVTGMKRAVVPATLNACGLSLKLTINGAGGFG